MSKFNISIFQVKSELIFPVFDETAMVVFYGLKALGHDVVMRDNCLYADRINIVLGMNRYDPAHHPALDHHCIVIINLEQIGIAGRAPVIKPEYFDLLRKFPVWDYSFNNVEALASFGIAARRIEFGYAPEMCRIEKYPATPVYDVLFYGNVSASPRRQKLISELEAAGIHVKVISGVYGRYRDLLISQSKVVVNIGHDDQSLLEMVRLSYLLNNDVAVVSEISENSIIDEGLRSALQPVAYDQLVQECVRLVRDETVRQQRIQACADYFKSPERAMAKHLEVALESLNQQTNWNISSPVPTEMNDKQRAKPEFWSHPLRLNVGCGLTHVPGWLNADLDARCDPDWHVDFSRPLPFMNEDIPMGPYGRQKISAGSLTHIRVHKVLSSVTDITFFMKNCLDLLCDGGDLDVMVPYDLSLAAWQSSANIRAFNEVSFEDFCEGHRNIGWTEHRFTIMKMTYTLNSFGDALQKKKMAIQDIARTPRAVEFLQINFRKMQIA